MRLPSSRHQSPSIASARELCTDVSSVATLAEAVSSRKKSMTHGVDPRISSTEVDEMHSRVRAILQSGRLGASGDYGRCCARTRTSANTIRRSEACVHAELPHRSSPRKRGPRAKCTDLAKNWVPACAGTNGRVDRSSAQEPCSVDDLLGRRPADPIAELDRLLVVGRQLHVPGQDAALVLDVAPRRRRAALQLDLDGVVLRHRDLVEHAQLRSAARAGSSR